MPISISYQLGSLPKVIQLPSGFSIDESGTQGSLLVLAALIGFRVLHLGFPEGFGKPDMLGFGVEKTAIVTSQTGSKVPCLALPQGRPKLMCTRVKFILEFFARQD